MTDTLPETILQFGGGRFLRAFADTFVHQANQEGQAVGRIVAVQSTEGERARWLNDQRGRYHVITRGLSEGEVIDSAEEVGSISRALVAQSDWAEALAFARSPELNFIFSNTTEAGLALSPDDRPDASPPQSFPAKLLAVLKARFESGGPGLAIIPTELIEDNADRLRALALEQARLWGWDDPFTEWLREECAWRNTLVDRIVTDRPPDYALYPDDKLLTVGEPYALWAIEEGPTPAPLFRHPAIARGDVKPYFLRKVRILNAAHTAMLSQALPRGYQTVLEAVSDPDIQAWLQDLLFQEIVPMLEGRVEEPERFAWQTLERFANPFLNHRLSDIAKYHAQKVPVRLLPTFREYQARFGQSPRRLSEAIQARIA